MGKSLVLGLGFLAAFAAIFVAGFASLLAAPTNPFTPDLGEAFAQIEQGMSLPAAQSAAQPVVFPRPWDGMTGADPTHLGEAGSNTSSPARRIETARRIGDGRWPNGRCMLRPEDGAVVLEFIFLEAFKMSSGTPYNGGFFIHNGQRSTFVARQPNGKLPAGFSQQLGAEDPRCNTAFFFMQELLRGLRYVLKEGGWPGAPLAP